MRKSLMAAAIGACFAMAQPAFAERLTFDDLIGTGFDFFTANYHGFTFGTNDYRTNAWFYSNQSSSSYQSGSGLIYVATDYNLYTGGLFEATQAIVNNSGIVFQGATFSGSDQIIYQLYNGSTLVHTSQASAALTVAPSFVSSGYSGVVTSIVIVGHQGYYAMDDLLYTNAAPVPEAGTLATLVAGLAGVAGVCHKRGKTQALVA